jgi:NhaP-type Na+/H+ and K+/H+ antiporter
MKGFTVLSELALTVILFNQASTLKVRSAFRRGHLPMRLMAIGIPVTIALNTAIAISVLPVLPSWEAVCLAVIVAPTEVALVDALLEDRRIPERVRRALSIESGLYRLPLAAAREVNTRIDAGGLGGKTVLMPWPVPSPDTHPATARVADSPVSEG